MENYCLMEQITHICPTNKTKQQKLAIAASWMYQPALYKPSLVRCPLSLHPLCYHVYSSPFILTVECLLKLQDSKAWCHVRARRHLIPPPHTHTHMRDTSTHLEQKYTHTHTMCIVLTSIKHDLVSSQACMQLWKELPFILKHTIISTTQVIPLHIS